MSNWFDRDSASVWTTWIGDSQVTYQAVSHQPGWVVFRKVAGAKETGIVGQYRTLSQAKSGAEKDSELGL